MQCQCLFYGFTIWGYNTYMSKSPFSTDKKMSGIFDKKRTFLHFLYFKITIQNTYYYYAPPISLSSLPLLSLSLSLLLWFSFVHFFLFISFCVCIIRFPLFKGLFSTQIEIVLFSLSLSLILDKRSIVIKHNLKKVCVEHEHTKECLM